MHQDQWWYQGESKASCWGDSSDAVPEAALGRMRHRPGGGLGQRCVLSIPKCDFSKKKKKKNLYAVLICGGTKEIVCTRRMTVKKQQQKTILKAFLFEYSFALFKINLFFSVQISSHYLLCFNFQVKKLLSKMFAISSYNSHCSLNLAQTAPKKFHTHTPFFFFLKRLQ